MQLNYYKHIDELPIGIWFNIHETGDFRKLLIGKAKFNTKVLDKLSDTWDELYDQFIVKFGLSDEFMANLRIRLRLAEYQAKYIIEKQDHYKTLIAVEKEKIRINNLYNDGPVSLESVLAKMSQYYKIHLRSRDLTVTEYYAFIENITNG